MNRKTICVVLLGWGLAAAALAQVPASQTPAPNPEPARRSVRTAPAGIVQGTVKDNTGGVIPGATVTLSSEQTTPQTTTTGASGTYNFRHVEPGTYTVSVSYTGLQQQNATIVSVSSENGATANIVMTVQNQKQEVTVTGTTDNTVSTEPSNNATALVLKKEDLDALPDDPDDLQADLEALAGPSAGPGGNQIYIDGFTGGRLPPKESIREIRINSNPFSAEFEKLGYGRIQIFTKPGSDRFHGQGYYNISDGIWNSRNPFLSVNPPFRTQHFGGNVSGPLGKHASFFFDVDRRNIDDNGIINATIPSADFLGYQPYQNFYSTPQRRTTFSPRVDYQLGANHTLSFRYEYLENDRIVTGIGSFNLPQMTIGNLDYPSTGYSTSVTEQSAHIVETSVLNAKAVNETHFRYDRDQTTYKSQSDAPGLFISQSFVSGGAGYTSLDHPSSYDLENGFELQNYTSLTWGTHTSKFGIRIRTDQLENLSPKGFNGEYQFLGGPGFPYLGPALQPGLTPNANGKVSLLSIDQYLATVQLLNEGYSSQRVVDMGYGPSKYTVNAGNPYLGFYQLDVGPFIQDDWRVKPNLTVSLGLRWESQTNIPDHSDWAPRFGFAWSPDAKGGKGRAKTVIRGGWGIFYDRFDISDVETAYRYNESNQQAYTLNRPAIFDATFSTPIPISDLTSATANAAQRYQIDSRLQAPRLMQMAIGVERQLFSHTTLSVNLMNSRGTHELRTVDINAPYPIPGQLPPGALGNPSEACCRPYGNIGDIYNYESDGTFKQTQLLVNLNAQAGRWLTIFSRYSYSNAHSDTDGLGTLPANPYNFAEDWGRSKLDVANTLFFGGSFAAKWGLRI